MRTGLSGYFVCALETPMPVMSTPSRVSTIRRAQARIPNWLDIASPPAALCPASHRVIFAIRQLLAFIIEKVPAKVHSDLPHDLICKTSRRSLSNLSSFSLGYFVCFPGHIGNISYDRFSTAATLLVLLGGRRGTPLRQGGKTAGHVAAAPQSADPGPGAVAGRAII